jgi:hypothetical protein
MINKIIKVKKGLRNNIMVSLLLGSSVAVITPIQASQRYSRGSRTPQPRRNVQENREHENEPVGLTKEEAAKLLSEGHEEEKKKRDKYWKHIDFLRGRS